MPETPLRPDFLETLRRLSENDVEFIVVGAVAAGLEGAITATEDLDFVYRKTEDNCRRLAEVLSGMDAYYLDPMKRIIPPTYERLRDLRINLLKTTLGRIDALAEIGPNWDYDTLLPRTVVHALGSSSVRTLRLDAVIESKEFANRPKDRANLDYYRAVLAEKNRHLER